MTIGIILGTRPEIIKLCPIIRHLRQKKMAFFVLHTNQHYSANMDKIFFDSLGLPTPRYNLNIGSGPHGKQTGRMLEGVENVLIAEKPGVVLVQGDTNTVLAGALATTKLGIRLGHVEAGLRSYDRTMPEEKNRILTDHISDYLFAPTKHQENILLAEAIDENQIYVVGNTIVDAVKQNVVLSKKPHFMNNLRLTNNNYFLVTIHRPENTDDKEPLQRILESLAEIYKNYNIPLFFPIHPRTAKMIRHHAITPPNGLILHEPVGYLDFLYLLKHARLALTDSGGVQEEACILQVPCVTLRKSTERPETVEVGANIVAGNRIKTIVKSCEEMLNRSQKWINPFGDGRTGERIINILELST